MTDQRFIIEMGMGLDAQGADYQLAASRAIEDAMGHAALLLLHDVAADPDDLRVQITVGVQAPELLNCAALAAQVREGHVHVKAVFGGQDVTDPATGHRTVVANAAVEAFLPYQGERWRMCTP